MTATIENAEEAQPQAAQSLFAGKVPIHVALRELRLKLLDLTGRNRLINFKHTPGKSLQFVHSTIDGTYKRLTEQGSRVAISALPEPDRGDWVTRNGRLARPDPKEYAAQIGIDPTYTLAQRDSAVVTQRTTPVSASELRTLFYAEDLGKHCRKLEREAKLAIEETGANMLYLAAGFLEFPETPDSDKLYRAPLLCIPVSISRSEETQHSRFYLSHTGDEIADNLSLREKLKRDFGFNLPEYDDESETTPEDYLKAVSKAVARKPNWRVRPMMTLTLLSFTNMLLVRDLEPNKWQQQGKFSSLLEHPLVKQVFEGGPTNGEPQYAEEYAIDDHPKGDLPLIYDADSSQHSALIDVLEGHSRVIEGPPGTGKSQTITNLIAAALHAGKKILFVAEKLAALEVVKSRLTQAGLDPFVLELHSNKTNKKRVLDDLAKRTNLRIPRASDPKQLPPTSFFARMSIADGDGDDELGQLATSDAESILDVCMAHFQPVRTLRWHYRSRHESLIAFSNQQFYRGNLVVFPSPFPKSKSLGLSYNYVANGVYENQMNQVEALRVVDAAVGHILHRPHDSLGIVTLNIKQRDLVAELLEERLRSLPQAADFKEKWEAEGMGLFIKNLENVQGDERDCIYISTTFGKARGTDVVRQNFGPISRQGGWRRLNVLFTRARKSVAVFSSMRPEDIVSDNKTPEGTRALRNYLEFARTGVLPHDRETGLPADSDFEIAVMDVLASKGYEVTPQLGVAGFRIDIAVKHPIHRSGYLAAIECDGASYHSGVSVRDRDRIRQEILESLGWQNRIWRIWSTDWFRNPLSETDRMLQFLSSLQQQPVGHEYLVEEATELDIEPPSNAGEEPEPSTVADVELTVDSQASTAQEDGAEGLVFDEDEEDLEIEVGDLVVYCPVDSPDEDIHVRLTSRQTNPEMGLVAETTPLGSVLIGATVGETIVLRVPGRAPQSFVVKSIKRQAH